MTKSVPGRNCPINFAVLRIAECDAIASLPDATSRSSQAARTFSARIARVPPGHRQHERDAGDRAVLDALRACRPHDRDAPRLEIEHREPLGVPHQRLGACPGRESHLDAARGVRGCEKRLRPRRVVAVREDPLRAVHRKRLRVGDEAANRELEIAALLHCALRHHSGPTGLRADEQGQRVKRRVARDPHRRLELVEAAASGLRRVGGEQGGALLEVRHMRLVPRIASRAELLEGHHQLDGVEHPDDPRQLGRCEPAGQPDELVARHVDVDEHPRKPLVGELHRLDGDVEIEPVRDEEAVDDVEVVRCTAVEPHDHTVLDDELRRRIGRPRGGDEPQLGPGLDEHLAPKRRLLARDEAPAPRRVSHRRPARARRRRVPPRGRTRPSRRRRADRDAPPTPRARRPSSDRVAAPCRSPAARRPVPR